MPFPTCALPGARTEFAGLWRRNLASSVDTLLLLPVFALVHLVVMWSADGGLLQLPEPRSTRFIAYFGLQLLVPMLLTVWCWCRYGTTPGKYVFQLRVVDARTGGRLAWDMAMLRYVGYVVSALPLGLGFLWADLEPQKQTWHDKMALSLVLYTPRA